MYLITDPKTGYLKSVVEPKLIDEKHYKFMGKVHPITGPLGQIPDNIEEKIAKASGTMDNTINCSNWWLNYIVFDINDRPIRNRMYMDKRKKISSKWFTILKHELKNKHINKMVA